MRTSFSLGQAARAAGVGKTTLARAIRSGRLSATRQEGGGYVIDAAELARVYPLVIPATVTATPDSVHRATPAATPATVAVDGQVAALREMLARADQYANELRADRDAWRAQAEAAQRLITDQRPRPSWWRRMTS